MLRLISAAAAFAAMLLLSNAPAAAQSRVALVIGNGAYTGAAPLKTTTADADLMTATLKAAGFDVTETNDLTAAAMGAAFTNFVEKVKAAGPNGVVFIYFAGYGAQFNGDSYLVPIDATIAKAEDVPNVTLSLTDITNALAAVPSAARIIVLDAARDGGFGSAGGSPVTPGLALVGVPTGFLVAYPAAPGADICSCSQNAANSPYVSSLATLLRQPGLDISQVFDGVRLQVNQASGGGQTPWMVSALGVEVKLFEATAQAPTTLLPACGVTNIPVPPLVRRKLTKVSFREMSAEEAYRIAIERDSLEVYQWFVEDFPSYRLTGQIWHIINQRRESILWHRALVVGTTAAYWNYLDRYPNGVYLHEARYWLEVHRAPALPRNYTPVILDLPPGYVDEASGLAYVVERGRPAPPPVFGHVETVYVTAVARWRAPQVTIMVRPPPPPPSPRLIVKNITVIQQKVIVQQPVQPLQALNPQVGQSPSSSRQQIQQKQGELQAWQDRLKKQQEELAKQYHAPVVTTTSILLPAANPATKKPTGVTIGVKEQPKNPATTVKQPVKPTIRPAEIDKPTNPATTATQPMKPTIGNVRPTEPVKPTIGNVRPTEPMKPTIGNVKPTEPVKPMIGNVRPTEPMKPTIGNVKPTEPVKPTIGNVRPTEPVKPTIGNVKPTAPVKPTIGNVRPTEPMKPTIGNVRPTEPMKPTIGGPKPPTHAVTTTPAPGKPTNGGLAIKPPEKEPLQHPQIKQVERPPVRPAEHPQIKQVERPPVRPAEHPQIKQVERPPVRPAEHPQIKQVERPPVRPAEHPQIKQVERPQERRAPPRQVAQPHPQQRQAPPPQRQAQHQPAQHPAGCPQGEHMANGHCAR